MSDTKSYWVEPGIYDITELVPDGWAVNVNCVDTNRIERDPIDDDDRQGYQYEISFGHEVTCTFTNIRTTRDLEICKVVEGYRRRPERGRGLRRGGSMSAMSSDSTFTGLNGVAVDATEERSGAELHHGAGTERYRSLRRRRMGLAGVLLTGRGTLSGYPNWHQIDGRLFVQRYNGVTNGNIPAEDRRQCG